MSAFATTESSAAPATSSNAPLRLPELLAPAGDWECVKAAVGRVERDFGKKFGDNDSPLLFSCRSGAAISMPGMMDTVLDIVSISINLFSFVTQTCTNTTFCASLLS